MKTIRKRPSNAKLAIEGWRVFMGKRLNGSSASRMQHTKRMKTIVSFLSNHLQVGHPQYQAKHFRSFLDKSLTTKGLAQTQAYFETIYQMFCLMNKDKDWLPLLNGPWLGDNKQFLKSVIENSRRPTPLADIM